MQLVSNSTREASVAPAEDEAYDDGELSTSSSAANLIDLERPRACAFGQRNSTFVRVAVRFGGVFTIMAVLILLATSASGNQCGASTDGDSCCTSSDGAGRSTDCQPCTEHCADLGWLPSKLAKGAFATDLGSAVESSRSMLARLEEDDTPSTCPGVTTQYAALVETSALEIGVWTCSAACSWEEASLAAHEVIVMLAGRLKLTEADGSSRVLTKDDILILPKGWRGRWDVLEPMKKLYVVMSSLPDSDDLMGSKVRTESVASMTARLQSPADPFCAGVTSAFAALFEGKNLEVGMYTLRGVCTDHGTPPPNTDSARATETETAATPSPVDDVRVVLSGRLRVTQEGGSSRVVNAGDIFFTPKGLRRRWEVLGPVSTLFIMMSDDHFAYRPREEDYDSYDSADDD